MTLCTYVMDVTEGLGSCKESAVLRTVSGNLSPQKSTLPLLEI